MGVSIKFYLVETNVIKTKETIDILTSMPNLKKIWIKANKKELELLREATRDCKLSIEKDRTCSSRTRKDLCKWHS